MEYNLVSGDNHIDLTYCPPDLWSSQVPGKWRLLVPRVEELDDGLHWFIEGRDVGMWNGIGPGFKAYQRGYQARIDKMHDMGFYTGHHREATPRPTTPDLRIEDLDKDGVDAEIVYGLLGTNDLIADGEMRGWVYQVYNDWVADFARRADPHRVFPLAAIPNHDPEAAAAEIRRCAKMGLRGGDFSLKRAAYPLWQREWYPTWQAAAECHFPLSFHSTGFTGFRHPDSPEAENEYSLEWRLLRSTMFQLDGMEVMVSLITSGACEQYPDFRFVLGESGVTWIPYVLDRFDFAYEERTRSLGLSMKPSDYFRRNGTATYQQDQFVADMVHLVGEDNIIWGTDYPHADCLWPESRQFIEENLSNLPEKTRKKITCDNVVRLYNLD